MKGLFMACGAILAFTAHSVKGSALTTTIAANDRTCFYAAVDKPGEKVHSSTLAMLLREC